jgi:prepilin peptidase CpaA
MMMETWIFVLGVSAYVAAAAYTDIRMHRIPNYITVPSAVLGLIYHAAMSGDKYAKMFGFSADAMWWERCGWSLLGFALGLCLLIVPFLLGGGGAGDVKLLAALGAWLGPKWLFIAFAVAMLTAAAIALTIMMSSLTKRGIWKTKRKLIDTQGSGANRREPKGPKRVVPFSIPVAAGTLSLLCWLVATQWK